MCTVLAQRYKKQDEVAGLGDRPLGGAGRTGTGACPYDWFLAFGLKELTTWWGGAGKHGACLYDWFLAFGLGD